MPAAVHALQEDVTPLIQLLRDAFTRQMRDALGNEPGVQVPWRAWESTLYNPLEDILARPGKALRARLVQYGWTLGGGAGMAPQPLPWLVELLHAGSIVVDDIEDDATLRRGKPALHRIHGTATALNAGNWLYFLPFTLLDQLGLPTDRQLNMHRAMSRCLLACHYGQALDLGMRVGVIAQREMPALVRATTRLKTGSLTDLALRLGATAAGASPLQATLLARFGCELGIGLQMADDLSSIMSPARAAKAAEDLIGGRPTWPWAWLAERLDAVPYRALQATARNVAAVAEAPASLVEDMRAHLDGVARTQLRKQLNDACESLTKAFPNASAVGDIMQDVFDLEQSYG